MIAIALIALLGAAAWVGRSIATIKMPPPDWEQDDWQ
jgi:hypothetical protein